MENNNMYRAGFFAIPTSSLEVESDYKDKFNDTNKKLTGLFCQKLTSIYKRSSADDFMFMCNFGPKRDILAIHFKGNEVSAYVSDKKGESVKNYLPADKAMTILDEARTLIGSFEQKLNYYLEYDKKVVLNRLENTIEKFTKGEKTDIETLDDKINKFKIGRRDIGRSEPESWNASRDDNRNNAGEEKNQTGLIRADGHAFVFEPAL